MRVVGLAALAVCAGLWAGEAGAATLVGGGACYEYSAGNYDCYLSVLHSKFQLTVTYDKSALDGHVHLDQASTHVYFDPTLPGDHIVGQANELADGLVFDAGSTRRVEDPNTGGVQELFQATDFGFVLTALDNSNECYPRNGRDDCRYVDHYHFANLFGQGAPGQTITYSYVVTDDFTRGSVPEPATWGLMILGFGMVGSTLRRRLDRPERANLTCA